MNIISTTRIVNKKKIIGNKKGRKPTIVQTKNYQIFLINVFN